VAVDAEISLTPSDAIKLDETRTLVRLNAGERKSLYVSGSIKASGYQSITASASASAWQEGVADRLGFNVASTIAIAPQSTIAALSASGKESLEDHVKNLPVVSDQSIHIEQIKADLDKRDNVRGDYIFKDYQYKRPDGSLTEPMTSVVSYLPGTGKGKPRPGDLDKFPKVSSQASCTQSYVASTSNFSINRADSNNPLNVPLSGFHVQVVDNNGWSPHTLIAEGETDSNGTFTFQKPRCDGNGDGSGPDIYYWIEAKIPNSSNSTYHNGLLVQNSVGYLLRVGTSTTWDDYNTGYAVGLNWNSPWESNALWMLQYLRFARDFNVDVGGTRFGVTVFWPGTAVRSNTAYAPVSRIVLGSERWKDSNPLVHEFGHNLRYYVGNYTRYSSCLGAFLPCDPWFAGVFNYEHGYDMLTSNSDSAVNEGWAEFFHEMARQYYNDDNKIGDVGSSVYRSCDIINQCSYPKDNGATVTNAERSEARISTFLWRYATEFLARSNPSEYKNAFKQMRDSLIPTESSDGYAWNIYDFWNRFIKKTYPTNAADINFRCIGESSAKVRPFSEAFKCLADQIKLDKTKLELP
jgi:hypothetical protein